MLLCFGLLEERAFHVFLVFCVGNFWRTFWDPATFQVQLRPSSNRMHIAWQQGLHTCEKMQQLLEGRRSEPPNKINMSGVCVRACPIAWGLCRDSNNDELCMVPGPGCDSEAGVPATRKGQPQGKGRLLWLCGWDVWRTQAGCHKRGGDNQGGRTSPMRVGATGRARLTHPRRRTTSHGAAAACQARRGMP